MESLVAEFGHPTYTPFPVIVARLLLAILFGAVIGFEREWRNRPAGLRTHILVCVAAATYGILTIEIMHAPMFRGGSDNFDPIRVVEAVTAGVAFLAAGVVIFTRGEVHGLTTGAGMWLAGAIGIAAGLGFWQIALYGTVLALIILAAIAKLQATFDIAEPGRQVIGEPPPVEGKARDTGVERSVAPKPDDPGHVEPAGRKTSDPD